MPERLKNPLIIDIMFGGSVGSSEHTLVRNSAAGRSYALSACYRPRERTLPSNPYTSHSSTFTELRQGWPEQNLITLNFVVFFLPSPTQHPVFGFFKQSIAHAPRSFACFSRVGSHCHCPEEGQWLPQRSRPHQQVRTGRKTG